MLLSAGVAFMLLLTLTVSSSAYSSAVPSGSVAPSLPTTVSIIVSCADQGAVPPATPLGDDCGTQSQNDFSFPVTEPASVSALGELQPGPSLGGGFFTLLEACGPTTLATTSFNGIGPATLHTNTVCESSSNPTGSYFFASGASWKWVKNPYPGQLGTTNAKYVLKVKLSGLVEVFVGLDSNSNPLIVFEGVAIVTIFCQQIVSTGISHHPPDGPAFFGQQDVIMSTNGGLELSAFTAEIGCSASIP